MRVVPRKKSAQIMFYMTRLAKWAQEAQALGLDPEQVASLQAKVEAARLAFNAQREAINAAQSRTLVLHNALDAMNAEGAIIIRQIRATAGSLGNMAYSLSQIPVPDKPSPIAPPGKPERISAELTQVGSIILRWSCKNPRGSRGTVYHVSRCIGSASGPWDFLGIAGRKKYEDATLPPGVAMASYKIQSFRSTALGAHTLHSVNLGGVGRGLPVPENMQLATKKPQQQARAA
jgi:hypothetical protein